MTKDDVRNAIFKAFAEVPKPEPEAVLACHCAHCLPLRDEFLPYSWDKVPAESVDRQRSHLSLSRPRLSTTTFRRTFYDPSRTLGVTSASSPRTV